ncbi:MAG: hypothetical protein PHR00_03280 [Patescibacteria group bacterium]|nr:hypothetical protein [Patescibacteria group bacterium]
MKKLVIFVLLIFGLIINLISCSDNPTQPKATKPSDTVREDKTFNLKDCIDDRIIPKAIDIPSDCYDWGRQAWAGDNNNQDFHAIQGWLQAVTLNKDLAVDSSGLVEIDYIALIERDCYDKTEVVVDVLNYESFRTVNSLSTNEGGLFSRWYIDNSFAEMTNSLVNKGILKIWPSLFPKNVSHWWMNSHGKYQRNPNKDYYINCRLRVTGNVAVQIAADYYKEVSSNYPDNTEAFHSFWIGQTSGKFVTVCYPN